MRRDAELMERITYFFACICLIVPMLVLISCVYLLEKGDGTGN